MWVELGGDGRRSMSAIGRMGTRGGYVMLAANQTNHYNLKNRKPGHFVAFSQQTMRDKNQGCRLAATDATGGKSYSSSVDSIDVTRLV